MLYGYARISTPKQSLDRQINNLKKYAAELKKDIIIVSEIYTGTKTDERAKYQRLKKELKEGDTLVFDSVSRMSRNADEGIKEYFDLMNSGINLVFIKERYIDTSVYKQEIQRTTDIQTNDNDLNETIFKGIREYLVRLAKKQIQIAFNQSEKEVQDLRERTKETLRIKKLNDGVILGRRKGTVIETKKAKEMKAKIKKLSKDFDGTLKDVEVMELLKIARNTYYKYKRELS